MQNEEMTGAALRQMIGWQFFAEGAEPAETQDVTDAGALGADGETDGDFMREIGFGDDAPLFDAGLYTDGELDPPTPERESPQDATQEPPQGAPQGVTLHIDGQAVTLTPDEIAARLSAAPTQERLDAMLEERLQADPCMQLIGRKAASSGMTVPQYLEAIQRQERDAEIAKVAQQTGMSGDLAQELLEMREMRQQMEEQQAQQASAAAQQAQKNAMFETFMNEFPGVKAVDVPGDIWQKVENGMDLTAAYAAHRVRELEGQLQAEKHHEHLKAKSLGSARGEQYQEVRDPVLDGLRGIVY